MTQLEISTVTKMLWMVQENFLLEMERIVNVERTFVIVIALGEGNWGLIAPRADCNCPSVGRVITISLRAN